MNFKELNVIEPIIKSLNELKYADASPIQERTIPLVLSGRDVMGCAQTGSGKTAAFAVPILQRLLNEPVKHPQAKVKNPIRALILTPTRELALQISDNINKYAKYVDLRTCAVFGGVDMEGQIEDLNQGIEVLVATPGRLLDLISQGYVSLSQVEILVLDEADRMLDMGFIKDILNIIGQIPKDRQTLMFSATMPKPIERLADTILQDPMTVMVDEVSSTVDSVEQFVYYVDEGNKLALLTSLLKEGDIKNAIVFTNTKQTAEAVSKHLLKTAIRVLAIHGDKSQNARQDALIQFKNGKIKVLVATDVAARGIDITKLSHVINYDIPDNAESYIHRIGRTGRAGLNGAAINLCSIYDKESLKNIEETTKKKMTVLESAWPMVDLQIVVKKKKSADTEEAFDLSKVKDIGLNGQPISKNKGKYHKEKFGMSYGKKPFGKNSSKDRSGSKPGEKSKDKSNERSKDRFSDDKRKGERKFQDRKNGTKPYNKSVKGTK